MSGTKDQTARASEGGRCNCTALRKASRRISPLYDTALAPRGLTQRATGVLGLGNIGGAVAQIGNAFGMKVIAWSQNLTTERAAEVGATRVSKNELFKEADIVSIPRFYGCSSSGRSTRLRRIIREERRRSASAA